MEMIFPLGKAVMIQRLKKWDLMSEISRCDEFSFGYYNTILFKKKTFLLISFQKFDPSGMCDGLKMGRRVENVDNVDKMQKIEKNQKKLLTFPQIYIILTYVIEAWLSLVERCVRDAEVASSNLVASTYLNTKACWSSGQDDALSRRKPGFDSRTGHLLLRYAAAFFKGASVAQLVEQRIRNA